MVTRIMAFIAVLGVAGAFATDMDHKGRVIATVGTANAGTAEVTCNNPGDWKFDVKASQDNGRDVVTVKISSSAASQPPQFGVFFRVPGAGVQNVWTSDFSRDGYHVWPQLWWGWSSKFKSQLARETPIAVGFNSQERAPVALACSEAFHSLEFGLYADDRTCEMVGRCEFFTAPVAPLREYEVSVMLDRRGGEFADTVRQCSEWVARKNGFVPAHAPESAFAPLYSTWYAYLQDVHADELEEEARLAAALGMKTMILDDGWQKVDSRTFYSATGDWMPVTNRFPDMKAHVAAVHKAGLKYMLWLAVPFMGDEAKNYPKFKGMMLRGGDTGVLDPRFPEVREYLISTYERVVGEWDCDGVKLDFIDNFVLPKNDPALKDNYAGRDYRSLPDAVNRLMKDVLARLKKIKPDVLVEFRQHYMGTAILQYGNMMRCADCPADPTANRKRVCDLRLTSGGIAVHSDMLVWSRDETPEGAALPILNVLFSTIQYSMILKTIPPAHNDVIRHWLAFSQKHLDALQRGKFTPHHAENGYTWIEGESADERVVAVYANDVCARSGAADRPVYLVNATGGAGALVDLAAPARVEFFDVFGKPAGETKVRAGIVRLAVPSSGYAKITWDTVVAALGDPENVAERISGYELWGMRPKRIAVVNPVLGEDPATTLDLSGEWEFTSTKWTPARYSFWNRFQERENWGKTRKIRLPGLLETQGIGEPGTSEPWDCTWDCSPKPLRHVFHGVGWMRRTVEIPSAWAGKRIWLKIGDVTSQAWFWVNDKQVAWHENYCGTYKYDITDLVTPGQPAKIVIEVTNQMAKRGGTRNSMNKWTGIQRALTLEATPETFIDDAWARGDFDAKCAEVHVNVSRAAAGRPPYQIRVSVEGETAEAEVAEGDNVVRLSLPDFRPWSPESPNLYTAKVELVSADGKVLQTRRERFGVRKFEVRGREFFLNGRPFYIRGVGYHNIQPVVGSDRIGDRDYRRREVAQMRAAGYNFARLHTRCETPEFFDACDELGLMVQPELPYYTDQPTEKFPFDPVRDVTELYLHYRRHPSFAIYSHGNEGTFGPALAEHLYDYLKKIDPDRLVLDQDNPTFSKGNPYCKRHNAPGTSDFVGGPIREWPRGTCTSSYPIVCHEYLNRSVKANAALEDKYVGIWQVPYTRKMRRDWLAKFGLTETWGDRLQVAQHRLQAFWQKSGIESARLDPWCNGYYHWSAQDATTPQGDCFTAQGVFDPFWGVKPGGNSPASFAVFNSADCVLCDEPPESRIVVSGDACRQKICFAHYSDVELADAAVAWTIRDKKTGASLAHGQIPVGAIPIGGVRELAVVALTAPEVATPVAASFDVRVGAVANAWDMWIFPKRAVRPMPGVCILLPFAEALAPRYSGLVAPADVVQAKVVVCAAGSEDAKAAAARGQSVVAIGPVGKKEPPTLGWWWLGENVGIAIADHPALAALPHSDSVDGLFFRILGKGCPLPVAGVAERDVLAVSEGKDKCSLFVSARTEGTRREAQVYGLDVCADLPEAKALLDGVLQFVCNP